MPYPTQLCLNSRFGESPCQIAEDNKCRVACGKGSTKCNRCIEPFQKRRCLLSGKNVCCGCACKGKSKKCGCGSKVRNCGKVKCCKRECVVNGCKKSHKH